MSSSAEAEGRDAVTRNLENLSIFWGKSPLGRLEKIPGGRGLLGFTYDPAWLDSEGPPVSLSLPLSSETRDPLISTNFFENFLPEGNAFGVFQMMKRIPPGDAFSFLSIYGRECAGALSALPFGESFEESSADYRDVTDIVSGQLALPSRERQNLIAVTNSKVSLAGAQNKLPVTLDGQRLLVSADGSSATTTHIIKAPSSALPDSRYNEAFCVDLARSAGLPVPKTELRNIGEADALVVERYDRIEKDGVSHRLHQEDICQALGLFSAQKHERRQGPGFSDCIGVVGRCSDAINAIENFAKSAIFNFIVGNGDAHGKNFSILYDWSPELGEYGKGFRLAPFYDLISTLSYAERGVDTEMAMSYGNSFDTRKINSVNFRALAKALGVDVHRFKALAEEIYESVSEYSPGIASEHAIRFPSVDIYEKIIKITEKQTNLLCQALDKIRPAKQTKTNKRNNRPR
ncbi:MAG: HipA domain-containing protein [Deltaproteobacteria bacterium]|nr:HipA domain-containing protein [Deltaproteobacteria bacterium]